jgi:phosphoenolpyruvate carboxylase
MYCFLGNPRVTPEVTRDVCLLARMMAANLYFSQIEDLMFEVLQYKINFPYMQGASTESVPWC